MGLSESRKRIKLSHDPRNLAWSTQSSGPSYGHRLMTEQGWSEGQALGARLPSASSSTKPERHHSGLATDAERLAAARVGILFKDDNLGLGAKRTGKDRLEGQRTGLDAFQGLLGRLNGKGEAELKEVERKVEARRLEMFFLGRWGGMTFVRGDVLVGSQGEKEEEVVEVVAKVEQNETGEVQAEAITRNDDTEDDEVPFRRKHDRRQRKEEKQKRKEEKRNRKENRDVRPATKHKRESREKAKSNSESESTSAPTKTSAPMGKLYPHPPPDEPVSSAPSDNEARRAEKKRKRKSEISKIAADSEPSRSSSPSMAVLKNGRHLLRGRNILAKRMVLEDIKGLDQIFMR